MRHIHHIISQTINQILRHMGIWVKTKTKKNTPNHHSYFYVGYNIELKGNLYGPFC